MARSNMDVLSSIGHLPSFRRVARARVTTLRHSAPSLSYIEHSVMLAEHCSVRYSAASWELLLNLVYGGLVMQWLCCPRRTQCYR